MRACLQGAVNNNRCQNERGAVPRGGYIVSEGRARVTRRDPGNSVRARRALESISARAVPPVYLVCGKRIGPRDSTRRVRVIFHIPIILINVNDIYTSIYELAARCRFDFDAH